MLPQQRRGVARGTCAFFGRTIRLGAGRPDQVQLFGTRLPPVIRALIQGKEDTNRYQTETFRSDP